MRRRTGLLLAVALSSCASDRIAPDDRPGTILELPALPALVSDRDTVRFLDGTAVREGGWSALARDPLDSTGRTFWAINDRGLNIPLESGDLDAKVFPLPDYHQKLVKLHLDGTRLRILSIDTLAVASDPSRFTTGLPSSLMPTGETGLRLDLRTLRPDRERPLVPSPDGLDFEGMRLTRTRGYLTEEYGPSFLEFDRATLRILRQWSPGKGLPPVYSTRRPNHGLEGLALEPSGKLAVLMQSPLWNWVGKRKRTRDTRIVRMLELDPRTGSVREFALLSDPIREGRRTKMGDLVALDDTRFLAIEHGKLPDGSIRMDLWLLDISKATDITSPLPQGRVFHKGRKTLEELMDGQGLEAEGIVPVAKTLIRGDFERTSRWSVARPEAVEIVDDTTVALLNDNDFGLDRSDTIPADGIPRLDRSASGRSSLLLLPIPSLHGLLSRP